MSKRRILLVTSALIAAATVFGASAGKREVVPVGISVEDNLAGGVLADARASGDHTQYIGCGTSWTYGYCVAVDATGRSGSCTSRNPDDLAIMRSVGPESYVLFAWNNKDGTCSALQVVNSSVFVRDGVTGL